MAAEIPIVLIEEVPLVAGGGVRTLAIDESGRFVVFITPDGSDALIRARVELAFSVHKAVATARLVMAGSPRSMTAHDTIRTLAAAVIALDRMLPPGPTPDAPAGIGPLPDGPNWGELAATATLIEEVQR